MLVLSREPVKCALNFSFQPCPAVPRLAESDGDAVPGLAESEAGTVPRLAEPESGGDTVLWLDPVTGRAGA